jgi:hypothetical protein
METREIPHQDWSLLCNRLHEVHNHGVVSVRVDRDTNHRELVGHTLSELKASNTSDGDSILISVGDPWEGYRGHTVANPVRVRLIDAPDPGEEILVIDGADGSTTVVKFYRAD